MRYVIRTLLVAAIALCGKPSLGKEWGIVVGINDYPNIKKLEGAVNDAKLLSNALRKRGVDLPESRILLNERATAEQFKQTWETVLKRAKPGDGLIVSFAGHGGQEEEFAAPKDEQDHKDETLIFYDFDPNNPYRGRISDDELYALFEKASAYRILFIADTCHSGGMSRAASVASALPTRGVLDVYKPHPPSQEYTPPATDDSRVLSHVTYLLATEDEGREIPEIRVPDDAQAHGALSWAFAQAFNGAADMDHNNMVTRRELEQYIQAQVPTMTAQRQYPGLLPRGTETPAFTLEPSPPDLPKPADTVLPVKVTGGSLPQGLDDARLDDHAFQLRFDIAQDMVSVFNIPGDRLTSFALADSAAWRKIIGKYRLMTALDAHYNSSATPVKISLKQGNGLHRLQERLEFSFDPNSERRHLLLFDLAGTGELQFLYPLREQHDPPALAKTPYSLELDVLPPTGEDDLVAVFCGQAQDSAVALLEAHNGKNPPDSQEFLQALGKDCQIGRYAFFTAD